MTAVYREKKTAKRSTYDAPSSCFTDREALPPRASGIPRMRKCTKTTDNLLAAVASSCLIG